ncbi:MAG: DMT family transporter [Flavobacteriales bacterium]|jgi:drug/metabolite transporter (DMT)-like permease
MQSVVKAHLALATVGVIYGANYVIAKSVMPDPIGPNSFITLRVLGATILFWLIAARSFRFPDKEDWGRFILCGLTGVAINQLCFFNGLSLTSPINSSIIMTSNPIMVMVISAFLLGHKINVVKIFGVALGAIGAVSLLILSNKTDHSGLHLQGDLFIIVNSLSYAFYLVLVKPLMTKYKPMLVIAWVFTVGLVAVFPFGGFSVSSLPWETLDNWQWFSVIYVIVATTFLAYLLNIYAIHILTPTIASAYVYFQPPLAALFSFIFSLWLDQNYTGDLTIGKAACTILIFIGIYLVSRSEQLKLQLKRK